MDGWMMEIITMGIMVLTGDEREGCEGMLE